MKGKIWPLGRFMNALAVAGLTAGMLFLGQGYAVADETPAPGCLELTGTGPVGDKCHVSVPVNASHLAYEIAETLIIESGGRIVSGPDGVTLSIAGDLEMQASPSSAASIEAASGDIMLDIEGNMTMGAVIGAASSISADEGDITIKVGENFEMQGIYELDSNCSAVDCGSSIESRFKDVRLEVMGNVNLVPGSRISVESRRTPAGATVYTPEKDSFLRPGSKNNNEGANPYLILLESGVDRDIIMGFGLEDVDTSNVTSARIVLTIDEEGTKENWGADGRWISIHRLLDSSWAEGNGKKVGIPSSEAVDGIGPGVTWLCSTDNQISDNQTGCTTTWDGGIYDYNPTDMILHTNGMTGQVSWDVTEDVRAGVNNWLIRRTQGGGYVRYFSKDYPYTTDPNDPGYNYDMRPRLIVEGLSDEEGVQGSVTIKSQGVVSVFGPLSDTPDGQPTDPETCPFFAISASPSASAVDSVGGTVTINALGNLGLVSVALGGCAIEAGRGQTFDPLDGSVIGGTGNQGGRIVIHAANLNFLVENGGAILRAVGDYSPADGLGAGGEIILDSTNVGLLWLNGAGDVRPVGLNDSAVDGKICVTPHDFNIIMDTHFPTNGSDFTPSMDGQPPCDGIQ